MSRRMKAISGIAINEKRLFDTKELAGYLSCGRQKARAFADKCGATRRIGNSVLFDRVVIDRAIDEMNRM